MNINMHKTLNLITYILSFLFLIPVVKVIILSFAAPKEAATYFSAYNLPIMPKTFSIEQYYDILIHHSYYLRMYWFTMAISVVVALFNTIFSIMSGYVLSKVKFKFAGFITFIYIIVMMMPFQVTLLPNYLLMKYLRIYDTVYALILPGIFGPLGTFLMTQFIKPISNESIEAAQIDTAGFYTILFHVVAPQVRAGTIALFIISFCDTWNMVEPVLVLTKDPRLLTLGTAFNDLFAYNNGVAFAGCVVYMMPVILLYITFKNEINESISKIKI